MHQEDGAICAKNLHEWLYPRFRGSIQDLFPSAIAAAAGLPPLAKVSAFGCEVLLSVLQLIGHNGLGLFLKKIDNQCIDIFFSQKNTFIEFVFALFFQNGGEMEGFEP